MFPAATGHNPTAGQSPSSPASRRRRAAAGLLFSHPFSGHPQPPPATTSGHRKSFSVDFSGELQRYSSSMDLSDPPCHFPPLATPHHHCHRHLAATPRQPTPTTTPQPSLSSSSPRRHHHPPSPTATPRARVVS
ncbi:hypothetical protein Tco_1094124 [Tanacetum coccineum]|uniref:Uncharacterized protein n=1 Tax=Tanacetum coccineum TaxID=301880 RepID=A0ABQ5IFV9_9ASTR